MHTTLDTFLFGTGITVLALISLLGGAAAAFGTTWVTYSVIRWFPIFVLREIGAADRFTVQRRDGQTYVYTNALIALNIGSFSIVLVNGGVREEGRG